MPNEFLDALARTQVSVKIFNPSYGKCIFVSNDKKGRDHVIEAHRAVDEERNNFLLEKMSDDGFRIFNPSYGKWAFVSNDTEAGDNVVEAHNAADEDRNIFELRIAGASRYKIFNPSYGKYVFVSNDIYRGDNVVEAHPHEDEERNVFSLVLPAAVEAAYLRWLARGEPHVDDWSNWLGAGSAVSNGGLSAYNVSTKMLSRNASPCPTDDVGDLFDNITNKKCQPVADDKGNAGVKTSITYADRSVTINVRLMAPDGSVVHNSTQYVSPDRHTVVNHTVARKADGAYQHTIITFKLGPDATFRPLGEFCQYVTRIGDWRVYDYQCDPVTPDTMAGSVAESDMLKGLNSSTASAGSSGHSGGGHAGGSGEGHHGGIAIVHIHHGGGGGGGGPHGNVTIIELN